MELTRFLKGHEYSYPRGALNFILFPSSRADLHHFRIRDHRSLPWIEKDRPINGGQLVSSADIFALWYWALMAYVSLRDRYTYRTLIIDARFGSLDQRMSSRDGGGTGGGGATVTFTANAKADAVRPIPAKP